MALYGSHDIFRADNAQGSAIRRQSAREAVQDAVLWLKDGNSVAVSLFVFNSTENWHHSKKPLFLK